LPIVHQYPTAAAALHSFPDCLLIVQLYTTAAAALRVATQCLSSVFSQLALVTCLSLKQPDSLHLVDS